MCNSMCYFNSWMCIQYYKNMRDYIFLKSHVKSHVFSKDYIFKVASKAECIYKVVSGERYLVGLSKAC